MSQHVRVLTKLCGNNVVNSNHIDTEGLRMRLGGLSIQNLAEIRAGSAEKAGYHLDCALTNRSVDSQVLLH